MLIMCVTVYHKKPKLPSFEMMRRYAVQVGVFSALSCSLHLPMLMVNELVAWTLAQIVPYIHMPAISWLCSSRVHAAIIICTHSASLLEMYLNQEYYREEYFRQTKSHLTRVRYFWDLAYSYFYSSAVTMALMLVLESYIMIRGALRAPLVDDNLLVAIVMLFFKCYWSNWIWIYW